MNYKDLKNVAEARKIMIKDLAEQIGMTPNGFKVSIETEKFPIGKVRELCDILHITIAEFFGEAPAGSSSMAAEPVPYRSVIKDDLITESATIERLVRHIAWLEEEIDSLKGKKHRSA